MNKIYHYLFDFDKQIITCVEGTYTTTYPKNTPYPYGEKRYGKGKYVLVHSRNCNKCVPISEIGVVRNGKYILMFERDDEKARKIFLDYLYNDINKQYERLSRFIEKYDFFGSAPITGGNL